MNRIRNHRKMLLILAAVILLAAGWLLFWLRIRRQMDQASYEQAFSAMQWENACYSRCGEDVLREYTDAALDTSLCGSKIGAKSFITALGTTECAVYRCKTLEDAGQKDAILILKREEEFLVYELTGFTALDGSSTAAQVFAAYGMNGAEDIASVAVYDSQGKALQHTIDSPEALAAFYDGLTGLGEPLSDKDIAKRCYDAYLKKYGDDGKVTLNDSAVDTADTETYDKAVSLWSDGMCRICICLKNGLQLRETVYIPTLGAFVLYGTYDMPEPMPYISAKQ